MVNQNNQSIQKINQFRDARNWRQFHNEKDLALSISLEASELLEIYQWKTAEEGNQNLEHIKEELADILIYAYMFVDNLQLDIDQIISEKIIKNGLKYPVDRSKNSKQKYSDL